MLRNIGSVRKRRSIFVLFVGVFSVAASGYSNVTLAKNSDRRPLATKPQRAQDHSGSWIGISIRNLPPEARQSLGEEKIGALIVRVNEGGPAEKAGLRPGDIVLEINRVRMRSIQDVHASVFALTPDIDVLFTVDRDGRRLFVPVVPQQLATQGEIFEAQRNLSALGFSPGPIDGEAGSRTQRAVRAFQAAKGLFQDGRLTHRMRDLLNYDAGWAAFRRRDFDGAVILFTKAAASRESNPKFLADAYVARGMAHSEADRMKLAIADWRKALVFDPDHLNARSLLETAYEVSGMQSDPSATPKTGEPEGTAQPTPQVPQRSPGAEERLDELLGLD